MILAYFISRVFGYSLCLWIRCRLALLMERLVQSAFVRRVRARTALHVEHVRCRALVVLRLRLRVRCAAALLDTSRGRLLVHQLQVRLVWQLIRSRVVRLEYCRVRVARAVSVYLAAFLRDSAVLDALFWQNRLRENVCVVRYHFRDHIAHVFWFDLFGLMVEAVANNRRGLT